MSREALNAMLTGVLNLKLDSDVIDLSEEGITVEGILKAGDTLAAGKRDSNMVMRVISEQVAGDKGQAAEDCVAWWLVHRYSRLRKTCQGAEVTFGQLLGPLLPDPRFGMLSQQHAQGAV